MRRTTAQRWIWRRSVSRCAGPADIDLWSESYFGEVYGLPKWEPSAVIRGTDAGWWRANALSAKLENDLEARLEAGGGNEGIGLICRIFDPSGDEE